MRWILLASLVVAACGSGGSSGCGGEGQQCCSNEMCQGTLVCTGIAGNPQTFRCAHCGNLGEPCCAAQPQCVTGAMCRIGVDTGPHCYTNNDAGP